MSRKRLDARTASAQRLIQLQRRHTNWRSCSSPTVRARSIFCLNCISESPSKLAISCRYTDGWTSWRLKWQKHHIKIIRFARTNLSVDYQTNFKERTLGRQWLSASFDIGCCLNIVSLPKENSMSPRKNFEFASKIQGMFQHEASMTVWVVLQW